MTVWVLAEVAAVPLVVAIACLAYVLASLSRGMRLLSGRAGVGELEAIVVRPDAVRPPTSAQPRRARLPLLAATARH